MRAALFLIVALVALPALPALPAQPAPPNVLLITLDTTRADRMGFLGSTRGLTPSLDAFAKTATVFERAYAQAPITTVSHATILSGTFPPFHGVNDFGSPLRGDVPYLPELLRARGYRTGAFVGSLVLDPKSGTAPGFDRGFDVYDAGFRLRRPGESRYETVERRADAVVARAERWLAESAGRPWFVWVHLFDAHDPYEPAADLRQRFGGYDGEIAAVDRAAGRLIAAARTAVVAVAADHGESLGDHGEETHGVFLYESAVHVPLIVRLSGGRGAGARVAARVRLADLAPTLLEAVDVARPAAMQGRTLLPFVMRQQSGDLPAYSESDYPRHAFGWSALAAWRNDRFLLIRAPKPELFDLVADPSGARDIAAARPRVVDGMFAELEQFIRTSGARPASSSATQTAAATAVPAEVAQRLAALGYIGGSNATAASTGIDPKDRIAVANALHTAITAVEDGAFTTAIPLLERVVREQPDIAIAQLNLGMARARQRQWAQAIPALTKAAALQPDTMIARYELGVAYFESGDLAKAAHQFEAVAAGLPSFADAHYSLGSVYARIDRVADAVVELRATLALEPRHFRANLLLGRILTLQNQGAAAVSRLQTAVDVEPRSAEAHTFLADAYDKVGNSVEAAKSRQRARDLAKK